MSSLFRDRPDTTSVALSIAALALLTGAVVQAGHLVAAGPDKPPGITPTASTSPPAPNGGCPLTCPGLGDYHHKPY
jgi:hypothetical protein